MHRSLIHTLLDQNEPPFPAPSLRIAGAPRSAKAFCVARYIQNSHTHSPCQVVLCHNEDIAQEFQTDLISWGIPALFLPGWEHSPHSPIAPSIQVRFQRLAVLGALRFPPLTPQQATHTGTPVVVTTLAGLCQATLPGDLFASKSALLSLHQTFESLSRVQDLLIQMGYHLVDLVEDHGTFAIRGCILDVFPIQRKKPIRIEFFGDQIEKMREFDPTHQRTLTLEEANLSQIQLYPCREILLDPTSIRRIHQHFQVWADTHPMNRSQRESILADIRTYSHAPISEFWAPFAYEQCSSFYDYLPPNTLFFWDDPSQCLKVWNEFLAKEQSHFAQSPGKKTDDKKTQPRFIPPLEKLFLWNVQLEKKLNDHSVCSFEPLDIIHPDHHKPEATDLTQNTHCTRVQIQPHPQPLSSKNGNASHILEQQELELRTRLQEGFQILIFTSTQSQLERIQFLLEGRNIHCQRTLNPSPGRIGLVLGALSSGWQWLDEALIVFTDSELLGRQQHPHAHKKDISHGKKWSQLQTLSDLTLGDIVVHQEHGLGRYQGLVRLDLLGAFNDFLLLEYANQDRLYLPIYRLNVIHRYAGEAVSLDTLGSQRFTRAKEQVQKAVQELAFDLVQLYAERSLEQGIQFSPPGSDYREFEAAFPFDETPDQLNAIEAIQEDLQSGKMMDRVICGDVGYGKTEIAMRAAFQVVSEGKQVAVLVPTTLLAHQHASSFKTRFENHPFLMDVLSRFKTTKEQKKTLRALTEGQLDILIGTHRLLSNDIHFKNLGLVIVDEEHRFGVEHKEKLKLLKKNTHVLTLTATPIPRTLHMALSGLRDISMIQTPPLNRLPIKTYVAHEDEATLRRAIEFELDRGGQIFYLHNRVTTIQKTAKKIQELCPKARVSIAHGQMQERELEQVLIEFYEKKTDLLVCTTIIESGMDLPSANTLIIDRADQLGLSQLYQIRGRVGRGQHRAYAYLMIPESGHITNDAQKRLEVIQRFVELGSGFQIASHDLEIRGGGDLLGAKQSGHIAKVGFELYTELLENAVQAIQQKKPVHTSVEPEIQIPFQAFLSENYIPDVQQRLSLYRRLSAIELDPHLHDLETELQDRFGSLPKEATELLWLIRVKQLLKKNNIQKLGAGPEKMALTATNGLKSILPCRVKSIQELFFQLDEFFRLQTRQTNSHTLK